MPQAFLGIKTYFENHLSLSKYEHFDPFLFFIVLLFQLLDMKMLQHENYSFFSFHFLYFKNEANQPKLRFFVVNPFVTAGFHIFLFLSSSSNFSFIVVNFCYFTKFN